MASPPPRRCSAAMARGLGLLAGLLLLAWSAGALARSCEWRDYAQVASACVDDTRQVGRRGASRDLTLQVAFYWRDSRSCDGGELPKSFERVSCGARPRAGRQRDSGRLHRVRL